MSALLTWLRGLDDAGAGRDDGPRAAWDGWDAPGDAAALAAVEHELGRRLPDDHRDLLLACDGGSLAGPQETVNLAPVADLVRRTRDGRFQDAYPGMVAFGDNGGGALYFYDPEGSLGRGTWAVFWASWSDLRPEWARFAGDDLTDVLHRVADGVSYFDEPTLGGH